VDLAEALDQSCSYLGVRILHVDSGGIPERCPAEDGAGGRGERAPGSPPIGGKTPSSLYVTPDLPSEEGAIRLRPTHVEPLRGGHVWLRHQVVR